MQPEISTTKLICYKTKDQKSVCFYLKQTHTHIHACGMQYVHASVIVYLTNDNYIQ